MKEAERFKEEQIIRDYRKTVERSETEQANKTTELVAEKVERSAAGQTDKAAKPAAEAAKHLTERMTKQAAEPGADLLNQEDRLEYLIQYLIQESTEYTSLHYTPAEAPRVLRSLMNLRLPRPVTPEFLAVQDAYLAEETRRRGVVDLDAIPTIQESLHSRRPYGDRISIWQGDITRLKVDAIVNAANSQMLGCFVPCHGCIDNAIHSAAGIQLREECARLMEQQKTGEPTGSAKITSAYNLPCCHVIHTVGPIVGRELTREDCILLKSCYQSCMTLASQHHLESLAFCCISTGEFHFPNDKAAEIAIQTVEECLAASSLKRVIFNVFKEIDLKLYEQMLSQ